VGVASGKPAKTSSKHPALITGLVHYAGASRRGEFTFYLHESAHLIGLVSSLRHDYLIRNSAVIGLITLASVILVSLSLISGIWLGGVVFCSALSLACDQLNP
jgi:hypothetical protein